MSMPASMSAVATPRTENGLPVNPWITTTPVGEPHEWEIGSQPSMTAASLADVTSEFLAALDP